MLTASQTPDAPAVTIRVQSSLVLVDLIPQDGRTALPLTGLQRSNLELFDNGVEMPIETFDSGARYATRPISLWLVGICNQIDWDENGSGFIRGKGPLLRPALEHLDKNDTIAVAHWCDNHKLTVQLTDAAKQKYSNSRLSFRPEYIPTSQAQASP